MKRILIPVLIGLSLMTVLASGAEQVVASGVKRVTVYTDRALVEREAAVSLEPGENRLVFDFLPAMIDSSSLQVKGGQGALLQDIEFQSLYYSSIPDSRVNALEEKLRNLDDKIETRGDAIRRAGEERDVLGKIIETVTSTSDDTKAELDPDKWIKMVDFYSNKTAVLDASIRDLERENRGLLAEREALAKEYRKLTEGRSKKKNQAIIILQTERRVETVLSLSYLVYGPSWYPDYDIRVDSRQKQIELFYNARVRQNTGENWEGIELILSTASPHIFGKQPDLIPWEIRLREEPVLKLESRNIIPAAPMAQMYNMFDTDMAVTEDGGAGGQDSPAQIREATVTTGGTAVRYSVAGAYTIDSDNNFHKVSVSHDRFPADFRYSAVPKLTPYAYLKARVTNNTELPLLSGDTQVFLDGDFVANSTLEYIAPGEEFWTFLGIDEGIEIEYKLISREFYKGNMFESRDGVRYQYKIHIKNNKKTSEEFVLWDQLPVTENKEIKITLEKPVYKEDSEALKKNEENFLEWFLELKPGEEKNIDFIFSIEYPKGETIRGL